VFSPPLPSPAALMPLAIEARYAAERYLNASEVPGQSSRSMIMAIRRELAESLSLAVLPDALRRSFPGVAALGGSKDRTCPHGGPVWSYQRPRCLTAATAVQVLSQATTDRDAHKGDGEDLLVFSVSSEESCCARA
jgi:hypothetical protein